MRFAEISLAGALLILGSLAVSGFGAITTVKEAGEHLPNRRGLARQALQVLKSEKTDRRAAQEAEALDEVFATPP
ncbi:MAG: hypothetical protein ACE5M4_08685, partial [Anaerolineales bacterium]